MFCTLRFGQHLARFGQNVVLSSPKITAFIICKSRPSCHSHAKIRNTPNAYLWWTPAAMGYQKEFWVQLVAVRIWSKITCEQGESWSHTFQPRNFPDLIINNGVGWLATGAHGLREFQLTLIWLWWKRHVKLTPPSRIRHGHRDRLGEDTSAMDTSKGLRRVSRFWWETLSKKKTQASCCPSYPTPGFYYPIFRSMSGWPLLFLTVLLPYLSASFYSQVLILNSFSPLE